MGQQAHGSQAAIEEEPNRAVTLSVAGPLLRTPVVAANQQLWDTDKTLYLTAFYNQFCNIIMMATFTGGVQAAVLAFMNDLLSADTIGAVLFKEPTALHYTRYTLYSLGLMMGLLAVALNVGVGAIAAANAALTCHFTIHPPQNKPSMGVRVLFCMLVMFVAFFLSGISLLLLSVKFDLPFTIVLAVLFFAAIVIAAFQFVARYGMKWIDALLGKPLHFFSVIVSTAAFIVDITRPDPSSWYTISAYGFTVLYHVVAVLYGDIERRRTPGQSKRPRRIAASCVTLLAIVWVGCVAVTMAWRLHYSKADRSLRYVLVALAGVEALLLGAIAVKDWFEIARAFRPPQQAGNPQDAAERGSRTTQS